MKPLSCCRRGQRFSRSFWESPTLEELAQVQNGKPLIDVWALFGTWPGDLDDGFEEAINNCGIQTIV